MQSQLKCQQVSPRGLDTERLAWTGSLPRENQDFLYQTAAQAQNTLARGWEVPGSGPQVAGQGGENDPKLSYTPTTTGQS